MFNPIPALPTEFDLPDTDNKPVDNEQITYELMDLWSLSVLSI
jgi:hypothetical protein